MKIYNEDKSRIIENPDLEVGFLKKDKIICKIIPAVEAVDEKFHYEYKDYVDNNGKVYGRDRFKVVDTPRIEGRDESYEYEDVFVYTLYNEEELRTVKLERRIAWFKEKYLEYEQMFTRRERLGINDVIEDKFRNKTYHNLIELYEEAEVVAKEIKTLRGTVDGE